MQTNWTLTALGLEHLEDAARQKLAALSPMVLRCGHILFRPGDAVEGFVMVLSGRVGVYLTGANGRELLLYAVEPGETCVQTTIGLLGQEYYTGEAVAETDLSVVVVPKGLFVDLMATSVGFRTFVFRAFADRLNTVMQVLEQVAFVNIETRLIRTLLAEENNGVIAVTHQELAKRIGSSREVVSRRLETLAKDGLVALDRGTIRLVNGRELLLRLTKF